MTTQSLQYSYSGADCDVFAIRGNEIKQLKSVATVSVSVYDAKAPVRALGHRSVKGYTGSIRTVAGSIVFVVVEGHPLEELMDKNSGRYHLDNNDLQVERLPNAFKRETYPMGSISPFKLMLMYKNEIGNSAGLEIDDIEFVSEGIVTSVNDMVTEVVVQFVATDFRQLTRGKQVVTELKTLSSTFQAPEELVKKILIKLGYDPNNVYNLPPEVINKIKNHLNVLATEELEEDIRTEEYIREQIENGIELRRYYENQQKRAERIEKLKTNKIEKELYSWFKSKGMEKSSDSVIKEMQFKEAQRRREQELRDEALRRDSILRRNREVDARRLSALEAQDQGASEYYKEYKKELERSKQMQKEVDPLTPSLKLGSGVDYTGLSNLLEELKKAEEEKKRMKLYDNESEHKAFGRMQEIKMSKDNK